MLARHRAKDDPSNANTSTPDGKRSWFSLGYKEGFNQWWANLSPAQTEHRVLSFVPHLQKPPTHTQTGSAPPSLKGSTTDVNGQIVDGDNVVDTRRSKEAAPVRTSSLNDPWGPRQWHSKLVPLDNSEPNKGKGRFLNEFSVERMGEETTNSLVMLHGYGAGLGFFYKNFDALSRRPHWKLYALDLLGMGRSSRPPFRINAKDREGKVREAENWFVDALEEWRIKRGIDKMTLLGHSLGGYMAVCYALKYPGHLNKLILASPVGFPEDPYAVSEALPEPTDGTVQNEVLQSSNETTAATSNAKPPPRRLPKWVSTLWDANFSPFTFVRLAGPLGPRLVSGWTTRRFGHLPPEEAQALHDYSYSLFRQRGSGEYALTYVLAPGAFARSPLIRRIQGVGRQFLEPKPTPTPDNAASSPPSTQTPTTTSASPQTASPRETGIPVVFIYGDHDWMDPAGGRASLEKIAAEKHKALLNATTREKALENGDARVEIVKNAGHHVYLDGWEEFNQLMEREMQDVEKRQRRLEGAKGE
ncbi:Alpha/Beta hydrolase protein [Neohortaea acidophila]|uniref:Alpha/Beta hydrolase protein n=1 Tax=Neohortaea acidophila TaxID=245834 RepID=A0A6A6PI99_9PEZI|nr:Alpha/Beta hydrolase protein [Neohortaea acidophila]KAF2479732.1 Alpha/Beta hydrolase protein [Neohortaea acidophila]